MDARDSFEGLPEPPVILPVLTDREWAELRQAKLLLENPGFAARLANVVGVPIEKGFELLPRGWARVVEKATHTALMKALGMATWSLRARTPRRPNNFAHRIAVGATGGVGGAVGIAALPIELPLSTTIMLRSQAEIARSEGFDVRDPAVRVACLEVFALGGRTSKDNAAENAYWAVRSALAKTVSEAAAYLARKGVMDESAPALARLVSAIGARFGVVVSEELAAKAVPVVGAAAGSAINMLFLDHFQQMARGHFIVKRLERDYGVPAVRVLYGQLALPETRR